MSKILDKRSSGYSLALHVMHGLEGYVGKLALQGGMGIALGIDASRQTGDIDMCVSADALAQLGHELPALVQQLFDQNPWHWTQCLKRDPELYLYWGGRDRSRRLRISWWPDDHGLTVRHRVSLPDFERFLGGEEESKDKPLNTYLAVANNDTVALRIQNLMADLLDSAQHEPFPAGALGTDDYLTWLGTNIKDWAEANGQANNIRFKGPDAAAVLAITTAGSLSTAPTAESNLPRGC